MCGITGLVCYGSSVGLAHARAATDLIAHRGPDDEGYVVIPSDPAASPVVAAGAATPASVLRHAAPYCPTRSEPATGVPSPALVLGHRRLSIVDLSPAGHQPMSTSDQRYWIVFNGEIYNHRELRRELEQRGHLFSSHTDTEVILAAYAEWGEACLERLKGMFAFLLYDADARTILAVRDRFGIKPLYYWVSPEGFTAFGSEIKQFSALPGWAPAANGQRTYDFLAWGLLDHTDETLFDGVFQVPPGYSALVRLEGPGGRACARLPLSRWYELRPRPSGGDFATSVAAFQTRFAESVHAHLQADVPVGSCLSGGLDSSAIVCAVNEELQKQGNTELQRTFTATADDESVDESRYVEEVTRSTRISGDAVTPNPEHLFDVIESLTWHQDEPFGSSSIYAQWSVFELAGRSEVKVLIDGQGADEQLAGYHDYFGPRFADLLRAGRLRGLAGEMRAVRAIHGYSLGWELAVLVDTLVSDRARRSMRRLGGKTTGKPDWLDVTRLGAVPRDPYMPRPRSVSALSLAQLTHSNLPMLLHWEDRDSMAHSIEARVPFLDHDLVEFVLGLPSDFKISGGVSKRVFREAVRGLVPAKIAARTDKIGFATPEQVWMLERRPDRFRELLLDAVEGSEGVIHDSVVTHFDEMVAGTRPFSPVPWRVISFHQWLKRFGVALTTSSSSSSSSSGSQPSSNGST